MVEETPNPTLHGVLLVDKPKGPTSHDIVARVRRILGTRAVGHAGTLDPSATGLLVLVVGEATKLVPYLTAGDKTYLATIDFGRSTTTLDAEGETTAEEAVPDALGAELASLATTTTETAADDTSQLGRALTIERARREQMPPIFSAIKIDGKRAHRKARRGEPVELRARHVELRSIRVISSTSRSVVLEMTTSKGYFVRSLARDLGASLGVPAHLAALRRKASGPFRVEDAVAFPMGPASSPTSSAGFSAARDDLVARLLPLANIAMAVLPHARLTDEGQVRAIQGKPLGPNDFASGPPPETIAAWLSSGDALIAIGEPSGDGLHRVRRGFRLR